MSPLASARVVLPAPRPSAPAAISGERYGELARRVRLLSWLSLGWMTIEGAVAIAAGIAASSIALVGFGLDSAIEGVASVIIVWRFTGKRVFSHAAELRAQRLVAIQFFLLAPYVAFESTRTLVGGEHPEASWVGIGLAIGSLLVMPILGVAKQRLADQLGSAATRGEGRQNMLCAYLAGALLVGLLGNALVGAWWLDPAVGLLIATVAVREGVETWRGEGCCASSPLDTTAGELPMAPAGCSLDAAELQLQGERYAAIGETVVAAQRTGWTLTLELAAAADSALIEQALAVEHGCCPQLRLDFDGPHRRLTVAVDSDDQLPALDAIAAALGVGARA